MASERADKIHKSFEQVATLAFNNIPKDIAVFMVVYIRDKSTKENGGDGTIDIRTINKNMMYYDGLSVREYIGNQFQIEEN